MPEVDLTNCDREPIHIIGHAQPHGVLLALDPDALTIRQASASVEDHFGLKPDTVLGRSVLELLAAGTPEALVQALSEPGLDGNPTHLLTAQINGRGPFHLVAHLHDDALIIEAEPVGARDERDYRALPRGMMRALQNAKGKQAYYDAVVHEARLLTGFDRVMLYRFGDDGTGVVVAEAAEPHLEPFLGLNYPASDIPQQARRLFALNTVRLYPDVDYVPSSILPGLDPTTGRPLDMTYCALRGVSSMHTQYLQNMGVKASMALAITQGERLWGLIALHHGERRILSYPVRASCELLAGLVSIGVAEKESGEGVGERERMRDVLDRLVGRVRKTPLLPASIAEGPETVLDLIDAGGASVVAGGEVRLVGRTPSEEAVLDLVSWLGEHQKEEVWAGEGLSAHYPPAREMHDVAAGLLSAQVSKAAGAYVLWFRPERVRTVTWAGDPNKPVEDGETLTPRRSFAAWKETVAGLSVSWTADEKVIAERLRLALVEALITRADEIMLLNVELGQRNDDLDTFAHVAAHDLKEPLRGIRNYSQFLQEDYADKLDAEGQAQLATIGRLAGRLEGLLDSLLRFARVSREELSGHRCDLGTGVTEARTLLAAALDRTNGEVVVIGTLPTVRGDLDLVTEIFVNLITNALKYNDSGAPKIEIEAEGTSIRVRDNGIGIPERHQDAVFTLFKRLHAKDAFGGGTGMGLTIVKKAMERLGGRVTLTSTLGVGTTFTLEFVS